MSVPQPSPTIRLHTTPSKPSSQPEASNGSSMAANSGAFTQNAAMAAPKAEAMVPPNFSSFSESTQEILKRVNGAKNISAGSAEWEKAREKVMRQMVVSNNNFPTIKGGSGPGQGGSSPGVKETTTPTGTPEVLREKKRGPGRPRGSGKPRAGTRGGRGGHKRKRSDEDTDVDDSDVSESYTPVATVTKSGRNVNKPTQYNPVTEQSPTNGTKRRRSYRRNPEMALCSKCQRGHSPLNNMVVFCDGCNAAYHQWCHDPHISKEAIEIPETEWICSKCQSERDFETVPMNMRVSGADLTDDERSKYFASLSSNTLASLLLMATKLHPSLPVFAPNTRVLLQTVRASSTSSTSMLTPPTSQPPSTASRPLQQPPSSLNPAFRAPSGLAISAEPLAATEKDVEDSDPYPDYSNSGNDPPATYPRPGTGPIKIRPTTDPDDLPWLLDENFEVFSHLYEDSSGHLVPVDPARRAREREAASVVAAAAPAIGGGSSVIADESQKPNGVGVGSQSNAESGNGEATVDATMLDATVLGESTAS